MNVLVAIPKRPRATRDQHEARMRAAEEYLFEQGWHPTAAARRLAASHDCSLRQAHRYVHAVRIIYRQKLAAAPAHSAEETVVLLHSISAQARSADKPDFSASVKALELAQRIQGRLDTRTRLTVEGTITHQHVPALEGASEEELAALAAFHQARERRLAAAQEPAVVGELPALSAAGRSDG